jgi:hypothetical protein
MRCLWLTYDATLTDNICNTVLLRRPNIAACTIWGMSRNSAVGIAIGYGLDERGVGVRIPVGARIFSSPGRPDWLWSPPNLSNGYRGSFPGGKETGA